MKNIKLVNDFYYNGAIGGISMKIELVRCKSLEADVNRVLFG